MISLSFFHEIAFLHRVFTFEIRGMTQNYYIIILNRMFHALFEFISETVFSYLHVFLYIV